MPIREIPDPTMARLGAHIRAIRKDRRVSWNAMEARGWGRGGHSQIEAGRRAVSILVVMKVAEVLGVDLLYLLAFDGESELARLVRLAGELPPGKLADVQRYAEGLLQARGEDPDPAVSADVA